MFFSQYEFSSESKWKLCLLRCTWISKLLVRAANTDFTDAFEYSFCYQLNVDLGSVTSVFGLFLL